MPETALTSALNATVITGDGNEGLLQNDMGNTLIRDSITGNIMSLSNGFVPLGMKERGGILYIASYNPQTKEGELGTIPSPIIHYTYNSEAISDEELTVPISDINGSDDENISISNRLNKQPLYILSDHVFHAGDKFIVILNLDKTSDETIRSFEDISITNSDAETLETHYPQISKGWTRGWFKIKLFAINSAGESFELDDITSKQQHYYILNDNQTKESPYWFIDSSDLSEEKQVNINKTRTQNLFNTYPNIQSGRLAIQFEEELPDKLDYLGNESFGKNLPQICYTSEEDSINYYGIVHGFTYKNGKCPVMPDKIEITSSNHQLYLPKYDGENHQISVNKTGVNKITIYTITGNSNCDDSWYDGQGISVKYEDFPKTNENTKSANLDFKGITTQNNIKAFVQKISNDYTFLISKRRHTRDTYSNYLSYSNYDDNETDGLFFIKLTDKLDIPVQLHVRLYTKDFKKENEETQYVLYDEYDLPEFIPLVEMGFGGLTPPEHPAQQYLDITGESIMDEDQLDIARKEFQVKLFDNVPDGYNSCFIFDGRENNSLEGIYTNTNQAGTIYKYGRYTTPYNDRQFISAKGLKTYIYPITKTDKKINEGSNVQLDKDSVRFLWYSSEYWSQPDYKGKETLSMSGIDEYPTVKSSVKPNVILDDGDIPFDGARLFPIYTEDLDDCANAYSRSVNLKQSAYSGTISALGRYLTARQLKEKCIFNTNLVCLSKNLIVSNEQAYTGWYSDKSKETDWSQAWKRGEEVFFKDELHLSHIKDYTIRTQGWNAIQGSFKMKKSDNKKQLYEYGHDFYPNISISNSTGSDGMKFRGYALGTISLHGGKELDYNDKGAYSHTPFLGFLIASSPGFIKADGHETSLFKLPIFKYNNSLEYLYTKKPKISFFNSGLNPNNENDFFKSAVTLNCFAIPHSIDKNLRTDGWQIATDFYKKDITGYTAGFKMNVMCNNNAINPTEIYSEYDDADVQVPIGEMLHEYGNTKKVLGIYQQPVTIAVPLSCENLVIETTGKITPNDAFHQNNAPRSVTSVSDCKILPYGLEDVNLRDQRGGYAIPAMESIEAQHILTSVQSNLFINLQESDLNYKNKSDYELYHLLTTDGIWSNNGVCTPSSINVEPYNLLNIPDSYKNKLISADALKLNSGGKYINSFCSGDKSLLQIQNNCEINNIQLSIEDNTLQPGFYVFNFNYNYLKNYNNGTIEIIIKTGRKEISTSIPLGQHIAAFYVKNATTIQSIDINIKYHQSYISTNSDIGNRMM